MTTVKTNKVLNVSILASVLLGVFNLRCASGISGAAGSPDTNQSEETLLSQLPGLYGWPPPEKFQGSVAGPNLPKKYVERVQTWLPRILKKDFLPDKLDPNQWHGIRKLREGRDFIVGQFHLSEPNRTVQFQANGFSVLLTAASEKYFPEGIVGLSDGTIIQTITRLVNYPEEKISNITLEKRFQELGQGEKKILVCYGRLRDRGYDEIKGPGPDGKNLPTWWNHMPFWIMKNKFFVETRMWENLPATVDAYFFKLE